MFKQNYRLIIYYNCNIFPSILDFKLTKTQYKICYNVVKFIMNNISRELKIRNIEKPVYGWEFDSVTKLVNEYPSEIPKNF